MANVTISYAAMLRMADDEAKELAAKKIVEEKEKLEKELKKKKKNKKP